MPVVPRIVSLIRNLFRRQAVDDDLAAEIDSYVEMSAAAKIGAGLPEAEAHRRALAEIGGRQRVTDQVRGRRAGWALEALAQDVRLGLRLLVRHPGFSVLAVTTLALGVAASTALFAVVDGVLLRPLPYPESDRLAFVGPRTREGRPHFSPPDYVEFAASTGAFEAVAAIQGAGLVTLSVDGEPVPIRARDVTTNVLDVYGAAPILGRGFVPADADAMAFASRDPAAPLPPSVILISHRLWQERFAGDPAVLGRMVEIDFQPHQIVGVTPDGFDALIPGEGDYRRPADVLAPTRMDFATMPRDAVFLRVVGRLRHGVALSEAQAEASLFAAGQRAAHPMHRDAGYEVDVERLQTKLSERHAMPILMLFVGAGFLMAIACANLAGLLLARSVVRHREFALRMALGSGRGRLIAQLVTENMLYAIGGVLLALPLAHWLLAAFVALMPASLPRATDVGLGVPAVVFALFCTLVAVALVSLVPAARLAPLHESSALAAGGRTVIHGGHRPWDRALVAIEVALSVILLVGTALLFKSVAGLLAVDPGFRAERVLTAELFLTERRYPRYPRADSRVRFARELTDRVSRLPGVDAAALALVAPLSGQDAGHSYASESMAAAGAVLPPAKYRPVTPGYFRAVGATLVGGRDFDWIDLEQDRLVSIVDERLAARAWPGQDPLGRRLRIERWSTAGGSIQLEPLWTEVVGVARNLRSSHLGADDLETVYLPYGLYAVAELSLLVRSSAPPAQLAESIRGETAQVDPDVALFNVRPLDALVADSVAPQRFSLELLGVFGVTGLALALIGVYAVLAHSVSARRREIGVRLALGARPADVRRLVLGGGARIIAAGIVAGLLAATGLSRYLESQLYGVSPVNSGAYGAVALLVGLVGLAACYAPARRASRIAPVTTLRMD